jgi:hypothetical protein
MLFIFIWHLLIFLCLRPLCNIFPFKALHRCKFTAKCPNTYFGIIRMYYKKCEHAKLLIGLVKKPIWGVYASKCHIPASKIGLILFKYTLVWYSASHKAWKMRLHTYCNCQLPHFWVRKYLVIFYHISCSQ